jgi:hypothetical protein
MLPPIVAADHQGERGIDDRGLIGTGVVGVEQRHVGGGHPQGGRCHRWCGWRC